MTVQQVEDGLIVRGSPFVIEPVVCLVGIIGLGLDAVAVLVEVVAPLIYLPLFATSGVDPWSSARRGIRYNRRVASTCWIG